ncbi:MAG: EAL domain-containing protein [Phaeospirillum sp.]|nr:EAL domain-containing protein [Phaeospirillum sp.]
MRDSLRRKLFLAFTGMALLPLLLAGAALALTTFRLQESQSLAIQKQVGRGIIAEFRNYLGAMVLELDGPARQRGLVRLDEGERRDLASGLLAFEPMFVQVSILDGGGKVLAHASRYKARASGGSTSLAHLPEVTTAMVSRTTALGNVRYDEATNEPVIGLAVPALVPLSGEVEGLLVVEARFRRVWEMTAPQPGLPDLNAYVLDSRGHVIAHGNPSVVLSNTTVIPAPAEGFSRGLSGGWSLITTEPMVVGSRRFVVVVEQPLASALRLPIETAAIVALVLLFAGLGAGVMIIYSRRVIVEPLIHLGDAVRAVEAGDLGRRAKIDSDDEIGALARSFNSMTARVEGLLTDLGESEEKFRLVAESTVDAMVVIDDGGRIVYWNRGAFRMFGYSVEEALGGNLGLLMPEHMRDRHLAILSHLGAGGNISLRTQPLEQMAQRKDDSLFPVEVSLATFMFHGRRFYSGFLRDITARKEAESNIRFLARHDPLTGLANRPVLHEKLQEALAEAAEGSRVCLLFIDLDNFKFVNDLLGHSFGDQLLRLVADRLRTIEGGRNTVCRHGGDEFILLAPGIVARDEVEDMAKQILSMMSEPFAIHDQVVEVGCSIGITMAPDDGIDAETLIRKADIAMYQAKERGRLGYQLFTAAMDQQLVERRRLEAKLRRAIKDDEIIIHLQPKFAFVGGAVIGFEALARWNSRELGMVPPAQFIPVAEDAGLISAIGLTVMRQVLGVLRQWRSEGRQLVPVAVNLSAVQLRNPGLVAEIEALLVEFGIPADLLELELTESMLMGDVADVRGALGRLRAIGIKLSIDDFGTGYSSLSYLKSFPLNVLKIDRSFVIDLPHEREGAAICLAIINMAKALSLEVVAEGVETEEQADFLRTHGCDFVQGYLFGRPQPTEQAVIHLKMVDRVGARD